MCSKTVNRVKLTQTNSPGGKTSTKLPCKTSLQMLNDPLESTLKLGVEVVSVRLKPRKEKAHGDGHGGGVNAFVRGPTIRRSDCQNLDDASPVWNEKFFFDISDTENLSNLILEALRLQ